MVDLPSPVVELTRLLAKLPGVGRRSAQRLAFHLLDMRDSDINTYMYAIKNAREKTMTCSVCGSLATSSPCSICSDSRRDGSIICIVSSPRDVFSMENIRGGYNGKYHVLGGALSPINGIGPEDLNITPLMKRIRSGNIKEIIFATNPDVEGEATASYLAKLIKPYGIKTTRIAHGIPMGSNLEYIDAMTLSLALEGRREM